MARRPWGDADRVGIHLHEVDVAALAGEQPRWTTVDEVEARIDEVATPLGPAGDVRARKSADILEVELMLDADKRPSAPATGVARLAGAVRPEAAADGALYLAPRGFPPNRGDAPTLRVTTRDGAIVVQADGAYSAV